MLSDDSCASSKMTLQIYLSQVQKGSKHTKTEQTEPLCLQAMEAASNATQPAPPKLKCVPVFSTAATTGAGLPVLHAFLSHLQPHAFRAPTQDAEKEAALVVNEYRTLKVLAAILCRY